MSYPALLACVYNTFQSISLLMEINIIIDLFYFFILQSQEVNF